MKHSRSIVLAVAALASSLSACVVGDASAPPGTAGNGNGGNGGNGNGNGNGGGSGNGSGTGQNGTMTATDFLTAMEMATCDNAFACKASFPTDAGVTFDQAFGTSQAACYAQAAQVDDPTGVEAAIAGGTIQFDGAAAADCAAGIAATACTTFWQAGLTLPAACDSAMLGTVADGGACTVDYECASAQSVCDPTAKTCGAATT